MPDNFFKTSIALHHVGGTLLQRFDILLTHDRVQNAKVQALYGRSRLPLRPAYYD